MAIHMVRIFFEVPKQDNTDVETTSKLTDGLEIAQAAQTAIPASLDGTEAQSAVIDGTEVVSITIDGQTIF